MERFVKESGHLYQHITEVTFKNMTWSKQRQPTYYIVVSTQNKRI